MPFSKLESVSADITKSKPGQYVKKQFNKFYPTKTSNLKFADVASLDRPAPTWRWTCSFPPIRGLTLDAIKCESLDIPVAFSVQTNDVFKEGAFYAYAQSISYETVSAEFYETEDYSTTAYFLAWKDTVFNPTTRTYGLPASYLKTVTFTLLPIVEKQDGNYATVELRACYPTSIGRFGYNSETGRVKVKVDFVVHGIEFSPSKKKETEKGIAKMDMASALQKALQWRS